MPQQYFVDIWKQINVIVVGHPAKKDKFCKHIRKVINEAEKYGKYLRLQWQKAQKAGFIFYDKNKDEKEWSWWTAYSEDFLSECVYFNVDECLDVQFYIKGKPEPDPLWYLASMILDCTGQKYEGLDLLDYQFTLLTIIYDVQNRSAGREQIYFNSLKTENLSDRLCRAVWDRLIEYDNRYDFKPVQQTIETAMLAVRAELDTELEKRLQRACYNVKPKLPKKADSAAEMENRFVFNPGQVLFDNNIDLGLPSGEPIEILQKLVGNFGRTVPYKTLNQYYSSSTPGTLPKSIRIIRMAFKKWEVPCKVNTKQNEGYLIQETTLLKSRQKRVRKK